MKRKLVYWIIKQKLHEYFSRKLEKLRWTCSVYFGITRNSSNVYFHNIFKNEEYWPSDRRRTGCLFVFFFISGLEFLTVLFLRFYSCYQWDIFPNSIRIFTLKLYPTWHFQELRSYNIDNPFNNLFSTSCTTISFDSR